MAVGDGEAVFCLCQGDLDGLVDETFTDDWMKDSIGSPKRVPWHRWIKVFFSISPHIR